MERIMLLDFIRRGNFWIHPRIYVQDLYIMFRLNKLD